MMLPVIVCSLLLLIWSWSDQICALLMDIWVVASILGFTNNTAVSVRIPIFGIRMYAFLMGVYKEVWIRGHGLCACLALGATDKAVLFQFWNNYIGCSLLLADVTSPRRLKQELDRESWPVSTWLCPMCSWQVQSPPGPSLPWVKQQDMLSCGNPSASRVCLRGRISLAKLFFV